jgi:recombinational DNA repair protein (RecF pathway)
MHRGRSLDVIVSADILQAPWQRLVQPERYASASAAAELVDAFCEPDLAMPDVYRLLQGMFEAVTSAEDPTQLLPRFSLRLLESLGLAPPADRCVRCTAPLVGSSWLDAEVGGLIDAACRERWRDLIELETADRENFAALATPKEIAGAAVAARPRVARAIEELLAYHLGRRPKASAHISDFAAR